MNYYFDTEFHEDGPSKPLELISIGIVAADGRELYLENKDIDVSKCNDWVKENVLPYLKGAAIPHKDIGSKILDFIGNDRQPRFWAYYGDYDWVLFCQLFGRMVDLPENLPQFALDLKQELVRLDLQRPNIQHIGFAHNALSDALWNKELHKWIIEQEEALRYLARWR